MSLFVWKRGRCFKVMKIFFKREMIASLLLAMPLLVLTGCGNSASDVSTIKIDAQGEIKSVIFDEFGESYYNIDELKEMALSETANFNADYISPRVFFEDASLTEDGSMIKLSMNYRSAKDYTDFNESMLFFGTIEEAENKGYTISDKLQGRDGKPVDLNVVSGHPEKHVIITNERANIISPFNIDYMTDGVELIGKKEAVLSEAKEETVQLLLSK